jgi:hypothetical protein
MKKQELIARLQSLPDDTEIFVCDERDGDLNAGLLADIVGVESATQPEETIGLLVIEEW